MTLPALRVDAAGFARAWLLTVPGLCQSGVGGTTASPINVGPLIGRDVRSPARGTVAAIAVTGAPAVDLDGYSAPVTVLVKSVGSEAGAEAAAERGALAVADAFETVPCDRILVTKATGEQAWLTCIHTVQGPVPAGLSGGEASRRVVATTVWQPA